MYTKRIFMQGEKGDANMLEMLFKAIYEGVEAGGLTAFITIAVCGLVSFSFIYMIARATD